MFNFFTLWNHFAYSDKMLNICCTIATIVRFLFLSLFSSMIHNSLWGSGICRKIESHLGNNSDSKKFPKMKLDMTILWLPSTPPPWDLRVRYVLLTVPTEINRNLPICSRNYIRKGRQELVGSGLKCLCRKGLFVSNWSYWEFYQYLFVRSNMS